MKSFNENLSKIVSQETPRDYRTEIPNIVHEMLEAGDITPAAFILYSVYRRIAGEHGACWVGTRGLAKKCSLSAPTITKLKKILSKPLKKLNGKSLIHITPGNPQLEEADTVTVIDIWPENFAFFKNKLTCVNPRHGGVKKEDTGVCKMEIHKKEPYKKEPYKNPPPLTPPLELSGVKEESLRSEKISPIGSEEEDLKIWKILEETTLSPNEKKRLSRQYTEEQVERAVKISKTQKIKSTLMGLLLQILKNPNEWDEPEEAVPIKVRETVPFYYDLIKLAKEYNEKLKQLTPSVRDVMCMTSPGTFVKKSVDLVKVANANKETISEKLYMYIFSDGHLMRISLLSSDFTQDIQRAMAVLR